MKNTLRELIKKALDNVESTPRRDWVYMWPGQIIIVVGQTYWTAHVEAAIIKGQMTHHYKLAINYVNTRVSLILQFQLNCNKSLINIINRKKFNV